MSNILSQRWLLNRRHFLRGVGVAMALPMLDAMRPLGAAAAAANTDKPRRCVFVYIPNGVNVQTWQLTSAGSDYTLTEPLRPLEKHRSDVTPISGLHHPGALNQQHVCADSWLNVPKPKVDGAPFQRNISKAQAGEYYRTMYDLIVTALRTDMTRVVTYLSGSESMGLAIPEIGITQTRHELSHHNGDKAVLASLTRSDTFLMQQFSYFLDRLKSHEEDGESLLDRSMVLFGSGMSYGHSHGNANLPIVLAGGRGLGIKHGEHIDFNLKKIPAYDPAQLIGQCHRPVNSDAHLSNLLLTMMQKMGVNQERFVDSLGPISEVIA